MHCPRIILIDSTPAVNITRYLLENNGYRTIVIKNIAEVEKYLNDDLSSLIIIGTGASISAIDAVELCNMICLQSMVPIIILVDNKKPAEENIIYLEAGADDYVTRSISPDELLARIRALLRRSQRVREPNEKAFRHDNLTIDFSAHRVTIDNREIPLSAREYKILSYLAHHAGRLLTTDQILEEVWGHGYYDEPHLLQVNINRIRHKLGDNARNPRYFLTRPGIGYMFKK